MNDKFQDFFNHEEVVVKKAARFLAKIEHQYKLGKISADEFKELANDALEISKIDDLANDLERKAAIEKAIAALQIIAKFVI